MRTITQKVRIEGPDVIVELYEGDKLMEGGTRVYKDAGRYFQGMSGGRLIFSVPEQASIRTSR